jgi:aminotransferase
MKDYSIVINSCSKKFSMTGWRLGYLAGPAAFVENLPKIQENVAACAGVPSQYAAIEAFKGEDDTPNLMRDGFEKRRNTLIAEIRKIDKLSVKSPKGTFYALVNIKETGLKSEEFAYKLLESQKVAVVPGITYGDACEGYVRIAFTMNEEKIIEGVRRIRQFVESL